MTARYQRAPDLLDDVLVRARQSGAANPCRPGPRPSLSPRVAPPARRRAGDPDAAARPRSASRAVLLAVPQAAARAHRPMPVLRRNAVACDWRWSSSRTTAARKIKQEKGRKGEHFVLSNYSCSCLSLRDCGSHANLPRGQSGRLSNDNKNRFAPFLPLLLDLGVNAARTWLCPRTIPGLDTGRAGMAMLRSVFAS